jgi:hypothetical protein
LNQEQNNTVKQDPRLHALTSLLHIQERMRWADESELRFIAVNELKELINFKKAILIEANSFFKDAKITAVSNTPVIDKNTPFILFFKRLFKKSKYDLTQIQIFQKSDFNNDIEFIKDWSEWMPDKFLWYPFPKQAQNVNGGIILTRTQDFIEGELNLLGKVVDALSSNLSSLRKNKPYNWKKWISSKRYLSYVAIVFFILFLLPLKVSVLAPAEVIAGDPLLIRAPLDGVIKEVYVKPNEAVKKGDVLIDFDSAEMQAQLDVAKNALKIAQTELRQISQEAMGDSNAMAMIAAAQGRVEREKSELAYIQNLSERSQIKASKNGIIIFEDVFDWLGRPVVTGERIMLLADPKDTKLEIQLNAQDNIPLPENTSIRFFSNATPHKPYDGTVTFMSYRAAKTADDSMAYRLKAGWSEEYDNLRLGQKGTAKIYGYRRPLIWQILRKPLTVVRQWSGL